MITLHHVPFSRSFRVLWLLTEMGQDCEIRSYDIADGSLRDPAFLAKSPAGRVPALEVDGKVLFESGAIVEYLCETRPEHGFGRAPGEAERAEYLMWVHFAETMAHVIANLNLQHIFLRDPAMRSPTVLKIEARRLAGTMQVMEQALADRDWLLPGGFSAADMMMGFNLFSAPYYVKMEPFPALRAYMARVEAREGYQAARALDGEQRFYAKPFYPFDAT
ncbi:glutathione S-transferase family protein [Thalassovita taeanensis]|uniref:Glutathione S-transferase n=1 Tax=Thalassovita taeanensis TaxID=657014 RepID=A0A1H9FNA8_9RHOB|nr:glutathione S-transferase family protein [Thalassovita taeanensis]SEQ39319.1 glutathione S-transferase [Thalassovita taeanensis]